MQKYLSRRAAVGVIVCGAGLLGARIMRVNADYPEAQTVRYEAADAVPICGCNSRGVTIPDDAVRLSYVSQKLIDMEALRESHVSYWESMDAFDGLGDVSMVVIRVRLDNLSDTSWVIPLSDFVLTSGAWFNSLDYGFLTQEISDGSTLAHLASRAHVTVDLPYLMCEAQFMTRQVYEETQIEELGLVVSRYPVRRVLVLPSSKA